MYDGNLVGLLGASIHVKRLPATPSPERACCQGDPTAAVRLSV